MLPELAFDGRNYLVAWTDRRPGESQIYFTQVAPDGRALSDTGIRLSGADSSVYYTLPAVASNADQYLVAWLGGRVGGDVILGSRITSSGEIKDTIPFEFSPDSLLLERLAAGSDGLDYLVAWTGEAANDSGLDLYCRRFSARGEMLDSAPVLVARSYHGLTEPAVTFGNGYYFVVWSGMGLDPDIYGSRILPDGTVLDPGGFPICADSGFQLDPALAFDGARFLVAWGDDRSGNYDIHAAFVDSSGTVGLPAEASPSASGRMSIRVRPEPFQAGTVISYAVPSDGPVRLSVYDAGGRLVRLLVSGWLPAGTHEALWDGRDRAGRNSPSGSYFCRFRTGAGARTARITKLQSSGR